MIENIDKISDTLFDKAVDLIENAKQSIAKAVNNNMIYTYFNIGQMIV